MINLNAIEHILSFVPRLSKGIASYGFAVLASTAIASFPAHGHEIDINMTEVGSFQFKSNSNNGVHVSFSGKNLNTQNGDSLSIKIPVFYSKDICETKINEFVSIRHKGSPAKFTLSQYFYGNDNDISLSKAFSLTKTETPVVGHVHRLHAPLTTEYPILDPVKSGICSKINSGPYASGEYYITLFFNSYNTFIQVTRKGVPIYEVFMSPVNFGSGDDIMNLSKSRSSDVLFNISSYRAVNSPMKQVKVYSFNWKDLLHDLNLNYGAKSIPVLSPVVNLGNSAAAAIMVSTN